jgi:RNA polymerase sigma-70 factor (ECF subfamily)
MDENDFYNLVTKYRDSIARIIYRLICSQEDTRDLMQDAFMKLWKHQRKLDNERAAFTYLYRTAVNLAIDWLRHQKSRKVDPLVEPDRISSANPGPPSELFGLIMDCAGKLKPKQKAVFILKDIEGFEFEEIAVLLNSSPANLRGNLHLARKKIRESLLKHYNLTVEDWYEL